MPRNRSSRARHGDQGLLFHPAVLARPRVSARKKRRPASPAAGSAVKPGKPPEGLEAGSGLPPSNEMAQPGGDAAQRGGETTGQRSGRAEARSTNKGRNR